MIAIYALTQPGIKLAEKIIDQLEDCYLFVSERHANEKYHPIVGSLKQSLTENWKDYHVFIMIMATGIVVRSIDGLLENKAVDPAVLVLDQGGNFVIPLLSGHLGGANDWAIKVSDLIDAQPVITTATDVQGVLSFDVIAKQNKCKIENFHYLKEISSGLLENKKVGLYSSVDLPTQLPNSIKLVEHIDDLKAFESKVIISERVFNIDEEALILRPPSLILGIGCRRGVEKAKIDTALKDFLGQKGLSMSSITKVVSIDLKADEQGIIELTREYNIPFITYGVDEISRVIHLFEESPFVKNVLGVGAVCEPAAYLGATEPEVIVGKESYDGITFALVKERAYSIEI
ncbi:cobalt-precorrin 5A hydrolase [Vallitalea okinawensis]|uniref:cobalt-precorrin 5A hydrolase n=1 Tax=Vallitalea okinawensis TaxID=2078660 RepID=UPI000CFCA723|nr:cobalt-precorrin 5A hydrolase [Vallitalea okinawensis]